MIPLAADYYLRPSVVEVAKSLIGKVLITSFNGLTTSARMVETEAYAGVLDKASHAYGGRFTGRNAVMYEAGGIAYVYRCYGLHHLFNIVTNVAGIPHAVLIRAIEPLSGIHYMLQRRGMRQLLPALTNGPGKAACAMGITTAHTGISLFHTPVFIADDGFQVPANSIIATPRIGVEYAGEDACLPYRFLLAENKYVSGNKRNNQPKTLGN